MSVSVSITDIFEDYVESLQNLPSEIDQSMHELRGIDEEFQRSSNIRSRESYTRHRRSYVKHLRAAANSTPGTPQTPSPSPLSGEASTAANIAAFRQQVETDYKNAMQKQDQKIELTRHMYDIVSRHIERIDSQMAKSGINDVDWITPRTAHQNTSGSRRSGTASWDDAWRSETPQKRQLTNGPSSVRKRTHHSSRPIPSMNHGASLAELDIDPNEPRYCICNQVSFGDMVACDGENCEKEWFHYACVGLDEPPAGKWFCDDCAMEEEYRKLNP